MKRKNWRLKIVDWLREKWKGGKKEQDRAPKKDKKEDAKSTEKQDKEGKKRVGEKPRSDPSKEPSKRPPTPLEEWKAEQRKKDRSEPQKTTEPQKTRFPSQREHEVEGVPKKNDEQPVKQITR